MGLVRLTVILWSLSQAKLNEAELRGRTTGSLEWRLARGELGEGKAAERAIQDSDGRDKVRVNRVWVMGMKCMGDADEVHRWWV